MYQKYFKRIISRESLPKKVRIFKDKGTVVRAYQIDSLEDAISFMKERKDVVEKYGKDSSRSREVGFHGIETYEKTIDFYDGEGQEMSNLIKKTKDIVDNFSFQDITTQEYMFKQNGFMIDVGTFLEGDPNCFLDSEDVNETEKILEINVLSSYAGQVGAEQIIENGAKLIAHLKHLELKKVRVKINAVFVLWQDHLEDEKTKRYIQLVKMVIKEYNQPFDYRKIVSVFHPSFYRRVIFKFKEVSGQISFGYGNLDPDNLADGDFYRIDNGHAIDGRHVSELIKDEIKKQN